MLAALPAEESEFYACEANVLASGTSREMQEDLEKQYGFLGGRQQEWEKYLQRTDLPPSIRGFIRIDEVKVISGVSAVPPKD